MRTVQEPKNGTETGQRAASDLESVPPVKSRTKLPKTHQDYWFSKLRNRSYAWKGKEVVIPGWQVRFRLFGRDGWFNLGTANKAAAAAKARDIFGFLKANGWEAAAAKFKDGSDVAPKFNLTVGEYLAVVNGIGQLRPRTFLNYRNCLRTIACEVFGVRSDRSRFDYRTGGNAAWCGKIDGVRLERLTPDGVTAWQQQRVRDAGNSPVAIAAARRTCNSYVRCARSLFSREIIGKLKGVQLPSPLPFDEVKLFEAGSMKYQSKINAAALIAAARSELKAADPEAYKAFLLGLFAGMRKGEVDLAEWRMVDFARNVIHLEETEWLHLKTADSAAEINLDPEATAELQGLLPAPTDHRGPWPQFIIASPRPPRNDSARPYYRAEPVFDRLAAWLRSKGITANKPLHELRKEVGAIIASEQGIYAASRYLRHSDITTTARHYADQKQRICVGLGKLLDTEIKPAVAPAQASQ
jgi:integrase